MDKIDNLLYYLRILSFIYSVIALILMSFFLYDSFKTYIIRKKWSWCGAASFDPILCQLLNKVTNF